MKDYRKVPNSNITMIISKIKVNRFKIIRYIVWSSIFRFSFPSLDLLRKFPVNLRYTVFILLHGFLIDFFPLFGYSFWSPKHSVFWIWFVEDTFFDAGKHLIAFVFSISFSLQNFWSIQRVSLRRYIFTCIYNFTTVNWWNLNFILRSMRFVNELIKANILGVVKRLGRIRVFRVYSQCPDANSAIWATWEQKWTWLQEF